MGTWNLFVEFTTFSEEFFFKVAMMKVVNAFNNFCQDS